MLNEDYKEMLQILLDNEVEFLLVGAYAMAAYGFPRSTGDIDLWVWASASNSKKIYASLKMFGAPLADIGEETFSKEGIVFQIGLSPRRIDILSHIDGVEFDEAYKSRTVINIEGLNIPCISRQDLIKNKLATGRQKDILDAKTLQNEN